ncbi:TetR family transcriptional regulator [Microbacterium sp. 179-I 3D2 NHS]|uniref:TetR family transcriptional regulator n=1 Tax=Microbacterium sp. 179-I 3D2 NHS TaxID=3235178 RepID=UPI0039A178AA
MRSASEDLTARARIRDTAIRAFARDGFDATSLRSIAREAEVSPALIVHHFGDKNTLRAECDAHVVSIFIDDEHVVIEAPTQDRIRAAMHDIARYGPYIDYLGRMLLDGSAAADRLFDALLAGTRAILDDQRDTGMLEPMSDPDMTTLLVTLIGLGPVIMRAQMARVLGSDQLSPAGLRRMTVPTLELLTHGIYSTTSLLDGARAALADEEQELPADGAEKGSAS